MFRPLWMILIFTCIQLTFLVDVSLAGIGVGISESTLVDTVNPELEVDPIADNIVLHAGDSITFHWASSDLNPGTTENDFTAAIWIDGQPTDSFSWYPDIDQYTWTWTAPEVQTSQVHLQVEVRDLLGNATIVSTQNFTVLLSTTSVEQIPLVMELKKPFPSPFNPSCEMSFSLVRNSGVQLQVFDTRGRHIKTLVEANLEAGNHQVHWNGTDNNGGTQPGGVYFFVMNALGENGPIRLVQKATLIP
ncbi:MAG: hypothetical protein GY780_05725 [bacterium]|nr:hypothetical protein [bacterium]